LNYEIWKNEKGEFTEEKIYVLFVDVGYSAYSVSLVAFQKGKLEVIATEFDQNLGGRNIDMMLAQRFAAEFQKKHNVDVFADPKAMIKLMLAVEKVPSFSY
jgi:heat shock protein 4